MAKSDDRIAGCGNTTISDARLAAVMARDASCDGTFVYAVKTTGIYCKPSCPSRRPNQANIVFHSSVEDAERAGFRACQRCHPKEHGNTGFADLITRACRLIETSDVLPNLDALAKTLEVSASHFHRMFKAAAGLSPKAYGAAHRAKKFRDQLAIGQGKVTDAIYDAGFSSSSRFYEKSNQILGMTPSNLRSGGEGASIRFALAECSLGSILVACSRKGVCAISLGDDPEALLRVFQAWFPKAELLGDDPQFEAMVAKIVAFVERPERGLDLPLDIQGTAFQQRVWQALCAIRAGETATYAQIAQKIGAPKAVRAVAGACAANRIAVAIPCHRVVRTDGSLSGYRWGVERKRALLLKEKG